MAASKTPGYSYCTRCGRGSIPTSDEACDCGFEAALERPRPAPPEDCSPEYVGAIIDATKETIAECVCAQDHPLLSGRFVGALLKRGLRIYPLRSAGTGAAPPDPLVQAAEEAANVLAGLATRVKWGGISNVSRSEEDHWRKLADDIRELIRGGAAQPPPSALTHEERDKWRSERNDLQRTLWWTDYEIVEDDVIDTQKMLALEEENARLTEENHTLRNDLNALSLRMKALERVGWRYARRVSSLRAPQSGPPFCPHGEPTQCASCAREREDDLRRAAANAERREAQKHISGHCAKGYHRACRQCGFAAAGGGRCKCECHFAVAGSGAAQPPPSAPEQANSRWVQTIVRSPLCQAEGHLPSGDDSYCLRCGAVQEGEK
jgi:hypothetical protein